MILLSKIQSIIYYIISKNFALYEKFILLLLENHYN